MQFHPFAGAIALAVAASYNAARQAHCERDMVAWRRAVAKCCPGYREFCAH